MSRNRFWTIFAASLAAVIVVAGVVGYYLGRDNATRSGIQDDAGTEQPAEPPESATREDVPAGTAVPEPDSQAPKNVAVPEAVSSAAPGVDSKKRQFRVELRGGAFVPDTVIIHKDDIANITFTAVDGDYDLVQPDYGFRLSLPQGESRLLEGHFATEGKYLLYCESCGGPESGPKGYIVVVP